MRLEITERGSKEFYEEFLYIAANYRKIRTKPTKKAHQQSMVYTGYCVVTLLVVLLFILEYLKDHDGLYLLLSGMMLVCFILFVVMVISMKKRAEHMRSETGVKVIEIDDKEIRFSDRDQDLRLKWDNVTNVIINKYSIVFMPAGDVKVLISINTEYKDQVLKAIADSGHMDLVVDNTIK